MAASIRRACRAERGIVHHDASGASASYGDVASDAAQLPVPANVKLKDPSQFKLIGTSAKRIDTPSKVNGTAVYGIDITAAEHAYRHAGDHPVKGGKLASMDEAAARRVPGVHDVIRNDEGDAVAVIGDHMWAAKQGLEALQFEMGRRGERRRDARNDRLDDGPGVAEQRRRGQE